MFFLAKRFVAGLTRQEALARAKAVRQAGFFAAIDYLGEHVKEVHTARAAAQEYVDLLQAIHGVNVSTALATVGAGPADFEEPAQAQDPIERINISVKPTHLGLDISEQEAYQNIKTVVETARGLGGFVCLDMEGSAYTDATLRLTSSLRAQVGPHVGVAIQSYLYRSFNDLEELIHSNIRVRLCKGAYKESLRIAFTDHRQINANYDKLCAMLMEYGTYPAIATHDEQRIRNAIAYARQYNRSPKDYEFQMLLGVRETLARDLIKSGFRVRLYLPYGKEWAAYFFRRVRERKENLAFALSSIFSK